MCPVKRTRNNQLPARNRRAVPVAQQAVSTFVKPLAQEQYVNALKVNGYPCVIYNKLQGGRVCTCSQTTITKNNDLLDENGKAPKAVIDSLLTGVEVNVKAYRKPEPLIMGDDLDALEDNLPVKGYESTDLENRLAETFTDDEAPEEVELNLDSETDGRCGICYGTGVVGGFSVHNGIRQVLDTTLGEENIEFGNSSVNQGICPNAFDVFDVSGYIIFTTVLPIGIYKTDFIRLWNNLVQLTEFTLEISNDKNTWTELTETSILQFRTGAPCYIKVSGVKQFTHLELQFNCSENTTDIEYPRISQTGDPSVIDAISGIQIVVSPLVPSVQVWDLIYDMVFQKLWVVESSNWFNDRHLNVHGWDVSVRLVQEYELFSRLRGRELKPGIQTTVLNR